MDFKTRLDNGKLRVEEVIETVSREVTKRDGTTETKLVERANPKKLSMVSKVHNIYTGEVEGELSEVLDIDNLRAQKQSLREAIAEIDDKISMFKEASETL